LSLIPKRVNADTIPKCYCECIDTTEIEGDKSTFFKNFEKDILKRSLKELQSFDEEEYHTFFTELYKKAFITRQLTSETRKGYVNYPTNPICELLKVYLRTRVGVSRAKKLHKRLGDTLNINNDIAHLKYRIWIYPTFCKQKILEVYINPKDIKKNKVVKHTFENNGWTDVKKFDRKIAETIVLRLSDKEWKDFIKKVERFNMSSLPQQMDEINFRYAVRDGIDVIVEVYDKGKCIHLLDYYSPIRNAGKSEHSKTFKAFFELVEKAFVFNTCE
jgi:hypothetical protein